MTLRNRIINSSMAIVVVLEFCLDPIAIMRLLQLMSAKCMQIVISEK